MADLSVMGYGEVLSAFPRLAMRLRQTVAAARAAQPHLVVGIDSKGFCLRLLSILASGRDSSCDQNGPVLAQYVAPSAWAFANAHERAARLAPIVDELLLLLPFEEALYRGAGVSCTFVGHPCVEMESIMRASGRNNAATGAASLRNRHGISATEPVITALPGSRRAEVRAILPPMLEALRLIAGTSSNVELFMYTRVRRTIADYLNM